MRAQRSAAGVHLDGALARRLVRRHVAQHGRIAEHHRQRIVELVGDVREQRAERVQFLALMQRLALAHDFGLGLLLLGQIDHAEYRGVLALVLDRPRGDRRRKHAAVGPTHGDLVVFDHLPGAQRVGDLGALVVPGKQVGAGQASCTRSGVIAHQLEKRLTGVEDAAVGAAHDQHRHGVRLGDRAKPLLAPPQRFALPRDLRLGALLLGEVEHARDDRHLALELDQTRGQRGWKHGAVGAARLQLEALHRAVLVERIDQTRAVFGVDIELLVVRADHLGRAAAGTDRQTPDLHTESRGRAAGRC